MKIRLLGAKEFPADRRTDEQRDMKKLIVAFRNFPNKRTTLTLQSICSWNFT